MPSDRFREGGKQELRLSDPIGERGAVEFDTLAGKDDGLAVQRRVITVFRDHDMRDQARPGPPALDRQRRHQRLHDRLARPAAQLRPQVLDHFEAGRDVFQHLALVLSDPAERCAAATRAGAGRLVDDGLTRQMGGQRRADWLLALMRLGRSLGGGLRGRIGRAGAGVFGSGILFELADQ